MPFTLSQLKSQDLRDIDHFYVQNNVGKVNNANAQVFEERNTFLPENEEDHPAHYEHKKKNKSHAAHLCTNIEGTGNLFNVNIGKDVRERVCSYTAFSSGMEEENDIFKTSTQVSAYRAFSSGVEEDNGILKTSTQVSASVEAPNIENYVNELKKKHKKSLHKDNLYENLCENFQTKKEKNKTKLKSVMDVKLQDSNEDVFQDTESSCATEGSSKPKKKKKKQKLLENGYALNNSFLRNDGVSVSNIDSNSASGKTKRKQKGNMNYDHDTITESLDYLNTADINKRKKRKLQSTCENNSEKNNLHFTSGALTENTDKLNDFVMPKNLKQEEDNTFSTDSDLLDSYLYFSYKNKQLKKKIKSLPMPIVIKTENDLDEEEQCLKNAMQNTPIHSDQSLGHISKRHKKKRKNCSVENDKNDSHDEPTNLNKKHKDHLVEQDKNDSHDEAKSINKKHKKKHKQALEDEVKSKDADSEQITSSNHEVHENAKCMPTDEEEQFFKNDMMNSSVHSDQSISSRSKKREKKHKDYLVEQDKNDSYGEAENINKKHKKKHKDYLVEEDKSNSHEEAQNINKEHKKKHKNCLGEEDKNDFHEKTQNINKKHKDYLVEDDKNDSREAQNLNKRKKKCKDYLVENKIDSHDEATNLNKRHKKKHKDYLVEEDKNDPYEEAQNINKKHKKKHRQQAFEDELRSNENEESYLSLKNVLLDTELPLQTSDVNDEEINLDSDRKSKKHKKKSKDRNNFVEITSVDKEKSIAEEEQENIKENFGDEAEKLIGKTESVSDECSEQKLKRKNKKCKLKVETRERKNDIISKPEVDESSSPDGPDDKHYLKKRNGGMEICNFKVGRQMQTGLLNTGDDTTTAGDIINEALDSAIESSIQLVEEYQFLKDLVIFISWEIPIAHTIETRMSSHPSPAQKQKFKELNIQLKQGPYTKEEDNKILSNFEEFCKVHDIPNDTKPFLNFKHGRQTLLNIKQRINFVQYLGKGLECRMLHSIYRRFVCLSTEKKKGRFTAEEDAIIEKYISNKRNEHDNNKFSTLAKILNRHRLAVEKRHKYLLSKQKHRKDNYKIKEHIPEYLKHLMEILEVNEVSQLKDMKITRNVWLKLADKIGQSEIKMKRLWETTIYPRLFAKNPIDRDGLMKQLILKLIKLKKTDFRDVNWCEMASEFENITPAYLYQMFKYLTVNFVPERKRHDLSSTLKHLARAYKEHDCIMKMQSKMEFKNGQVSFVTGS